MNIISYFIKIFNFLLPQIHEFMEMSSDMKTQLKWKLFLERCAARVLVLRPSSGHPSPLISLLSCTVADPADVTAYLPMY